ncbi:MAG: NADPH:quinone oxidoreductase family protein [Rhodococcus sp. (in: high G+C Gram-positive bacteria)]|nr:MAG: NADPH:quinone oxidoreductase family protein [Rhodococcus sp. (in: high G+C Gram-positive bacteria)]
MRAVRLIEYNGPDAVEIVDIDEPLCDGNVLVDLHAAGVGFPDLLLSRAGYQVVRPLPALLGMEGSGVVRSAPGCHGLRPGQRVAVFSDAGTWQQTVAIDPQSVFPLPDTVSFAAGAGFLLNYLTVHFALDERARYRPGETVLVHGAARGIGVAALQVASALGLHTIAVVSTDAKAEVARANGATFVIGADGFKDHVLELTQGRGVDIILDPVGGERFTDSLRSLAPGGRAVVLGFTAPTVKVNRLLLRNISVVGAGWAEYMRADPSYPARQWATLGPLLENGDLTIVEPTIYPIERAADALRALDARAASGKIVLALR